VCVCVCVCVRVGMCSLHVTFSREGITQIEVCDIAKLCKRLMQTSNAKVCYYFDIIKMLYSD